MRSGWIPSIKCKVNKSEIRETPCLYDVRMWSWVRFDADSCQRRGVFNRLSTTKTFQCLGIDICSYHNQNVTRDHYVFKLLVRLANVEATSYEKLHSWDSFWSQIGCMRNFSFIYFCRIKVVHRGIQVTLEGSGNLL